MRGFDAAKNPEALAPGSRASQRGPLVKSCMAITITFDAKPHALPAYDDSAIAPERRLDCRAEFAVGHPEIDAGKDAP